MPEFKGHMYIACRPCGRVNAAVWDDMEHRKSTARSVAKWLARGDDVTRVAVYEGDPQPSWTCGPAVPCACRDGVRNASKLADIRLQLNMVPA